MKVLVTGSNGQLGSAVVEELRRRGVEAIGSGSGVRRVGAEPYVSMDITDRGTVDRTVPLLSRTP